jgi:O-antigen/teichoic acid export membrane protein
MLALAYQRTSALLGLVFMPAGVAASLMAPEIVRILLGAQWGGAIGPFRILALGMVFRTGFKLSSILANSVGAPYRNSAALGIYAALVVGGALVMVPFGITAVAASTVFALLVVFLLLTRLSLKLTGSGWRDLLSAYGPALRVSLLVGVVIMIMAEALRGLEVGAVATLAGSFAGVGTVLLAMAYWLPAFFGPHSRWFACTLMAHVPRRQRVD